MYTIWSALIIIAELMLLLVIWKGGQWRELAEKAEVVHSAPIDHQHQHQHQHQHGSQSHTPTRQHETNNHRSQAKAEQPVRHPQVDPVQTISVLSNPTIFTNNEDKALKVAVSNGNDARTLGDK